MDHENLNCPPNWGMSEDLVMDEDLVVTRFLVDKVQAESGARLSELVRKGRRDALQWVSRYRVVVSEDGTNSRTLQFEHPPSLAQIADVVGADVFIVSFDVVRKARNEVVMPTFVAE